MTAPAEISVHRADSAIGRAAGYALLARSLGYPDDASVEGQREAATVAEQFLAGTSLAGVCRLAKEGLRSELEPAYQHLFKLSFTPDVPTFETAFLAADLNQQTHRMADIAGFYRAFGVDVGTTGYRPDDICVELEFMGYLCRKQAYAVEHLGAPRVNQSVRAQRLFMREHLGRWGASLGLRIAACAEPGSFYAEAGRALAAWLAEECDRLKTGPVDTVDTPQLEWPEPPDQIEPGPELIDPDSLPVL